MEVARRLGLVMLSASFSMLDVGALDWKSRGEGGSRANWTDRPGSEA
jgi:hypothetical protein